MYSNMLNILSIAKSSNPQIEFEKMIHDNPRLSSQYNDFLNYYKGKTPEQIARENNIDINMVRNLLRK